VILTGKVALSEVIASVVGGWSSSRTCWWRRC